MVYRADADIDEAFELFSVSIAGRPDPVKIEARLQDPGSVGAYRITPGGQRIVYLARQGQAVHLYSAPVDGGAEAIELAGTLVAGGNVLSFSISSDGERVAYVADQDTEGVNELFCVPTDGSGGPVKLNAPLPPGGSVRSCVSQVHPHAHFTSDGEHVVYVADQEVDNVFELYNVARDGATNPVKLNAPRSSTRARCRGRAPDDAERSGFAVYSGSTPKRRPRAAASSQDGSKPAACSVARPAEEPGRRRGAG